MTRRRVITERDVRKAAQDGARELDAKDAVVTPSARDAAARSGITFGPAVDSRAGSRRARESAGAAAPITSDGSPAAKPPAARTFRIALGADHGGVALKDAIAAHLRERAYTVTDHGTSGSAAVDYPDFAIAVARAVAGGAADVGIMVDGAGIGSCMAANKVQGVRAAMCHDVTTAINAREHNNANLLTLGGGLLGARLALSIVDTFLGTEFAGGRHSGRVAKIDALDSARAR